MRTVKLLTAGAAAVVVSLIGTASAGAGEVNPPKYRESFNDTVCGIDARVDIKADNPPSSKPVSSWGPAIR